MTEKRVFWEDLERFACDTFGALGATHENAMVVSKHLVEASLRGVDSHGISRIPVYAEGIATGDIDPKARPEVLKESASSALIDGRKSFGQVAASLAVEIAGAKAKKNGLAAIGARNLNHVGMLSYYGSKLAENELIGKILTNGFPRVAPWGGRKRLLGTNPICLAFPLRNQDPLLIDISTAVTAAFKIVLAAKAGQAIPRGLAVAPDGTPTTDPNVALQGALLPMAGHKGYGLGVSVEILSSILTGSKYSIHIKPIAYTQGGLYLEATSIGLFREPDDYYRDVREFVDLIKQSPLAEGFDTIYLPGEPEMRERKLRSANGIPIADSIWNDLMKLATNFSVPPPPLVDVIR